MANIATLRDMINWCIENPNQGEKIDPKSDAMKALEAYIYLVEYRFSYWSGQVLSSLDAVSGSRAAPFC